MVDTRDLCELFDKRKTPFFFDFAAYRHTIGLGERFYLSTQQFECTL